MNIDIWNKMNNRDRYNFIMSEDPYEIVVFVESIIKDRDRIIKIADKFRAESRLLRGTIGNIMLECQEIPK